MPTYNLLKDFIRKNKTKIIFYSRILLILVLIIYIARGLIFTPETIVFVFLLMALSFGRGKQFLIDWVPVFLFFVLYEFVRGRAYKVHRLFNIQVDKTGLLTMERWLFGENIPTLIFQKFIQPYPTFLDYFAFFIYTSFFWGAFLTGFILWIKDRKFFLTFRNAYVILCYAGVLTYLFYPAYPPWLAAKEGFLPPLESLPWTRFELGQITFGLFKKAGYNLVAPMPSLHTGWSVLSATMMYLYFKQKIGKFALLFFLYPLSMMFTIIYTSDHYVVDIIAGAIYALFAILASFKLNSYLDKRAQKKLKAKKEVKSASPDTK